MENTVVSEAALGQGLRAVFEGVGRRFGPVVNHVEELLILNQYEIHIGPAALNLPRLDITSNA